MKTPAILLGIYASAALVSAETCSTAEGPGSCLPTSICKGTPIPGYCSGGNDIQCCVSVEGLFGVDIADPASQSTYECFDNSGFGDMTIPRGFRSTGQIDTNVCSNLKNAKAAGIQYRDTYMFPCPVSISAFFCFCCSVLC